MTKLSWHSERSERISDMEYDTETLELEITFKRGGVYKYSNVEPETYTSLVNAESVGRSFGSIIRANPERYPYVRIS